MSGLLVIAFQVCDVQFVGLSADDWSIFLVQFWEMFDEAGSQDVIVCVV